jgi:hypothetical protein
MRRASAETIKAAAQCGAAAQCRAVELLAGGDSGSSTIENGNPDWSAWNAGAVDNAASRA